MTQGSEVIGSQVWYPLRPVPEFKSILRARCPRYRSVFFTIWSGLMSSTRVTRKFFSRSKMVGVVGGQWSKKKKRFFNFSVQNFWQGWGTPCFMVSNYRANLNEQYKPLTDPLRPKMRAPDPLDWSSPPSVTGQRSPKQGRKVKSDHSFYPSLSARVQE